MNQSRLLLLFLFLCPWFIAQAQTLEEPEEDHSYHPLQVNLTEDGKKFVRILMWHQIWARYTENNPGTLDATGTPQATNLDLGLRRSRMLFYAQISPRFILITHFGINNQRFNTGGAGADGKKPQLFIHEAMTEFMIVPQYLSIGAGLHYWNGLSRSTNASTLNFMALDAPIFNWPLIEKTDQFGRQMGVYAKGKIGKLDYRLAVNNPFTTGIRAEDVKTSHATDILSEKAAFAGYLNYQFFDQESNKLPYMVGTYISKKKIMNLGLGFHHQQDATACLPIGDDQAHRHDMRLFAADFMLELPKNIDKGTGLSLYAAFYHYDFGPNYLRMIGIMNTASGALPNASLNGGGNNQPTIGTGTIGYAQIGYSLPKMFNEAQFMPYITVTNKNFDALAHSVRQFDAGVNYFINGHHAKITLQYSNRPVIGMNGQKETSKGEFILQTHIFL